MSTKKVRKVLITLVFAFSPWFPVFLAGGAFQGHAETLQADSIGSASCSDVPTAEFQRTLLEIGFKTAAKIPTNPHIKDRSKAQAEVVDVCLKLGLPDQAFKYIRQIETWRGGNCYAKLALYQGKAGCLTAAKHTVALAEEVARNEEDWRKSRIETGVSRAKRLIERTGIGSSTSSEEFFVSRLEDLKEVTIGGDYEGIKTALEAYTELHDEYYSDQEKRATLEEQMRSAAETMPVFLRIDLFMRLAESALKYVDPINGSRWVNEARSLYDQHDWPVEHQIPLAAKIIELRFRTGDTVEIGKAVDDLYDLYSEGRGQVVNIYRAETLRPIAETYQVIGERVKALAVYKRVLEEGMENLNSRPRAEDLSATCSSLALYGLEPDPELYTRIQEIHDGLQAPW